MSILVPLYMLAECLLSGLHWAKAQRKCLHHHHSHHKYVAKTVSLITVREHMCRVHAEHLVVLWSMADVLVLAFSPHTLTEHAGVGVVLGSQ